MSKCLLCGEETDWVVNIRFRATPVCDRCSWAVTKQTVAAHVPSGSGTLEVVKDERTAFLEASVKELQEICGRHVDHILQLQTEALDEKASRVYYQSIVYDVCNQLDRAAGFDPRTGQGVVCGTKDSPSSGVQLAITTVLNRLKAMERLQKDWKSVEFRMGYERAQGRWDIAEQLSRMTPDHPWFVNPFEEGSEEQKGFSQAVHDLTK